MSEHPEFTLARRNAKKDIEHHKAQLETAIEKHVKELPAIPEAKFLVERLLADPEFCRHVSQIRQLNDLLRGLPEADQ